MLVNMSDAGAGSAGCPEGEAKMTGGAGKAGPEGRRHSLQRFVHRTLVLRLAAGALAMAVFAGL
ncbi:MAG: hypothetical protein H6Q84_1423, partial [Deltaproteobacteria bacterium]|nr:hypothetical protein [Deltaproteobacteria bacterium]